MIDAWNQNMAENFTDKSIGSSDAIKSELGRVSFHIYGMKEPDYVMLIMSLYGQCQSWVKPKTACHAEWSPSSTHLQVP